MISSFPHEQSTRLPFALAAGVIFFSPPCPFGIRRSSRLGRQVPVFFAHESSFFRTRQPPPFDVKWLPDRIMSPLFFPVYEIPFPSIYVDLKVFPSFEDRSDLSAPWLELTPERRHWPLFPLETPPRRRVFCCYTTVPTRWRVFLRLSGDPPFQCPPTSPVNTNHENAGRTRPSLFLPA